MTTSKSLVALLLGTTLCASSAPISWGPATNVNTDADVSLNGELLEAVNGSSDGFNTSLTINGVTFVSDVDILDRSSDNDSFTNPDAPNNLDISADYESLLSTVDFGDGPSISLPSSGSLIQGESYEIQVWFADTRNPGRMMQYTDDANPPGAVVLTGGDVQYAIGTFVADGPTQTLGLLATNFGREHITAYQLRALSGDSPPPTPPGIINWGDVTDATADTDISTNGDLVIAVNATGDGVSSNPTVNGVEFTSTGTLLSSSSTTDTFDRNTVSGNNISAAYDELLSSVDFGSGSSPTIQLAGSGLLIPDEQYEVQVWFADTRNERVVRFSDEQGNSVDLGGGIAQYAIGTFTASGANQGLQILPQGFNAAHINAYQVRALSIGDRLLGNFSQAAGIGNDTFEITLNFSQEVTGLTESDLVIDEGSLVSGSLSGSGAIYNFSVTSTNPESFTISLPADSVTNANDEESMNLLITRTFTPSDIIPGPAVTLFQSLETVSDPYVVTVHFDQAISGLSLEDFVVTNGTLSQFVDHTLINSDNIANYSVTVTPTTEGTVTLTLPSTSVTSDTTGASNLESNVLITEFDRSPRVEISGPNTSSSREFEVFFAFTPQVDGFDSSDIVVTNGSIISFEMQGRREFANRFYKATIQAETPGEVSVFVPAGSAVNLDFLTIPSASSNLLTTTVSDDFGADWVIDSAAEWAEGLSSGLTLSDGFAEPSGSAIGTYSSVIQRFDRPQVADKLTLTQTPVWSADRWTQTPNVDPPGAGNGAPIFLPIANDDYFFFALADNSAYHTWHSTDMENWTRLDQFSGDGFDRATSAEYKDGTFYLLVDTPNDHTPSMFTDTRESLSDGQPGTNHGIVIPYANAAQGNFDLTLSSPGGDSALFRDNADDLFHVFSENHAPIDAPNHSFDSPLANHVTSADGINGFIPQEHLPPIDLRSTPTDPPQFEFYNHPHVSGSPISNPRPYHVHIGEQEALGDWSLMKIGERYYAFGDYEREVNGEAFLNTGILVGDSLYDSFEIVADVGPDRHPDPTTGFAEGQFYLITQQTTDFISSGPWVDGVEARAGVDTNGDDIIDEWTDWQSLSEGYDHTPGYPRIITLTPAAIDMSGLSAGLGFQFELRLDDNVVSGSTPIMDRVEMSFNPSNFQILSNTLGIPVDETGDFNANGIPNLIEFAIGQDFIPLLQEDGTIILPATSEALADGYRIELQYSTNLIDWDTATATSDEVRILTTTTDPNSGDLETVFQAALDEENRLFWRVAVF